MAASRATENSVLVLQANQINFAEIQKIRGLAVRGYLAFGQLEPHSLGIPIAFFRIVHRQRQKLRRSKFRADRVTQIGGKCRNPALSWQVIPKDGHPARQHGADFCRKARFRVPFDNHVIELYGHTIATTIVARGYFRRGRYFYQ